MTNTQLAVLSIAITISLPLAARSEDGGPQGKPEGSPSPTRGACEFAAPKPEQAGLFLCIHTYSELDCFVEAEKRTSIEWTKEHPARFLPGVDCKDSDELARKRTQSAKSAGKAKGTKEPKPATKPKGVEPKTAQ
jgi:hypothetical protein